MLNGCVRLPFTVIPAGVISVAFGRHAIAGEDLDRAGTHSAQGKHTDLEP